MLQLTFIPFPELTTERLLLRKMRIEDAPEIFFLRSDETVLRFLAKEPAVSLQEAIDFINRLNTDIDAGNSIMWGIALRDLPEKLIGSICFWQVQLEHYRAEIGYVLHPDQWRKGIMKEALNKVIMYAFEEMRLHSIEARIGPENTASASLLESAGFTRDAYFKQDYFFRDQFLDTAVYSLLNDRNKKTG